MSRDHAGDRAREDGASEAAGDVDSGPENRQTAGSTRDGRVNETGSARASPSRTSRLSELTDLLSGKRRAPSAPRAVPAEERPTPPPDDSPAGRVRNAVLEEVVDILVPEPPAEADAESAGGELGERDDGEERDAGDAESAESDAELAESEDEADADETDAVASESAGASAEGEEASTFEEFGAAVATGLEPPTEAFLREQWFDFSYLEDAIEVERYWVNRPFAYVSILYDEEEKTYSYHVTEPILDSFEQYVREDLVRILRNSLMYQDLADDDADRETVFREKAKELIAEHAATVDPGVVHKLVYYLLRDFLGLGQIDPLMRDDGIEDVSCDGAGVPVYVYHRGYRDLETNVVFQEQRLNSFVVRLAQRAGKHLSISDPLVDASLPDGSRIQLTLGTDISTRGSNFTVRKFADVPFTPIDLVKWNTFSVEEMAYLWLCIENNRSLIFAGGTGSGKTTSMNAIGFFVPPDSKVVSIEDTREITLPNQNWIQSVSRASVSSTGRGEVGMYQLLQAALRQRPEYIIVGEIRTEQRVALTFFQAIATGHTAYTTVHSDSVHGVLARLENPPLSVPTQMIQELDVVCVQKQIIREDRRVRRNESITELRPSADGENEVELLEVFNRDASDDEHVRVADSGVLDDIADFRGWDREDVEEALERRERVLDYLLENDVTGYDEVAAVIHTFAKDPDYVMSHIERDSLEPAVLAGGGK